MWLRRFAFDHESILSDSRSSNPPCRKFESVSQSHTHKHSHKHNDIRHHRSHKFTRLSFVLSRWQKIIQWHRGVSEWFFFLIHFFPSLPFAWVFVFVCVCSVFTDTLIIHVGICVENCHKKYMRKLTDIPDDLVVTVRFGAIEECFRQGKNWSRIEIHDEGQANICNWCFQLVRLSFM